MRVSDTGDNGHTGLNATHGGHPGAPKRTKHRGRASGGGTKKGGAPDVVRRAGPNPLTDRRFP